jgi:hypothetical protein
VKRNYIHRPAYRLGQTGEALSRAYLAAQNGERTLLCNPKRDVAIIPADHLERGQLANDEAVRRLSRLAEYATHREECNVYSENVAETGCECSCGFEEARKAACA